jgi:cytochrome c553
MKPLLLLCVLGSALALAGEKKFELKGDAAKGETVYKTYCHLCHGDKGDGTGHIGRGLATKPVNFTDPKIAAHLTGEFVYRLVKDGAEAHGRTVLMIPWKGVLKDQELRDVSAYTLKLVADAHIDAGTK